MSNSTHFHRQLLNYLRQYSQYGDLRHLKALGWMVSALICSGQMSLPAWEPYVPSSAQKAQSVERRWRRFLQNERICVLRLYVPKRACSPEWRATAPTVSGPGHHGAMESLVHDSSVAGMLWTSHGVPMAGVRTR